ncbi:C69 family dipeptidase [bacterium]|nr:C69 family dipeptidase [bacterium]
MKTTASFLLTLIFAVTIISFAQKSDPAFNDDACTDIVVGRLASVDGSVITSHTDACDECRVHVVKGRKFPKGAKAPVYWGIQNVKTPLDDYGEILGYIPQVRKTYTYFHSGYSHMNEHQLAIGESTTSQKKELRTNRKDGKQIMTVEQAMIFALQRCTKAKEAVSLIGGLMEKYGFLPSCGPESETLCIADPDEAWVIEIFSVGTEWDPNSGKPGAIWAAERVPDDHVLIVPNWSIIKKIDLSKPNRFMASGNYKQAAIDHGWWNPKSGEPFIWQKAYSPVPREWAISRFWLFYSTVAPHYKNWPNKKITYPYKGYDSYHQYLEDISFYPFSVKPEKKLSVQDVIAFQRALFKGTIYDMTNDFDWYVPDGKGGMKKSPLTTPFPTKDMRELLDITYRRMVTRGGYGMVAQLRNWLPDAIGGVYWLYLDNQYVSTYVPIYAGVTDVSHYYKEYNPDSYSETSARWAVDFVDNLLYLKWQEAIKDVRKQRDPLEKSFFDGQKSVDEQALKLYKKNPAKAKKFLTGYTKNAMNKTVKMYLSLRDYLITKYTNNKQHL